MDFLDKESGNFSIKTFYTEFEETFTVFVSLIYLVYIDMKQLKESLIYS